MAYNFARCDNACLLDLDSTPQAPSIVIDRNIDDVGQFSGQGPVFSEGEVKFAISGAKLISGASQYTIGSGVIFGAREPVCFIGDALPVNVSSVPEAYQPTFSRMLNFGLPASIVNYAIRNLQSWGVDALSIIGQPLPAPAVFEKNGTIIYEWESDSASLEVWLEEQGRVRYSLIRGFEDDTEQEGVSPAGDVPSLLAELYNA